jgi:hypothetical protein
MHAPWSAFQSAMCWSAKGRDRLRPQLQKNLSRGIQCLEQSDEVVACLSAFLHMLGPGQLDSWTPTQATKQTGQGYLAIWLALACMSVCVPAWYYLPVCLVAWYAWPGVPGILAWSA